MISLDMAEQYLTQLSDSPSEATCKRVAIDFVKIQALIRRLSLFFSSQVVAQIRTEMVMSSVFHYRIP